MKKIKKGDIVEFIHDGEWYSAKVYHIDEYGVKFYSYHMTMNINSLRIFDESDYTLRHSVWNRDLEPGDNFKLICEKPKSTLGNIYCIYKVVKVINEDDEYWYYNDEGKLQTLYDGDFHVISEKL